jgi:NADPH:quinone reductase-like Zn-dependent oxidoreductase
VIDAVGPGVGPARTGQRVWLWEASWQRADGTPQEYVALPARQAVALPPDVSFDVGASLGIPALTAHRGLPRRRQVGGGGAQGVGEAGSWLGERAREPGQDDTPLFLRSAAHGQDPHSRRHGGRE